MPVASVLMIVPRARGCRLHADCGRSGSRPETTPGPRGPCHDDERDERARDVVVALLANVLSALHQSEEAISVLASRRERLHIDGREHADARFDRLDPMEWSRRPRTARRADFRGPDRGGEPFGGRTRRARHGGGDRARVGDDHLGACRNGRDQADLVAVGVAVDPRAGARRYMTMMTLLSPPGSELTTGKEVLLQAAG